MPIPGAQRPLLGRVQWLVQNPVELLRAAAGAPGLERADVGRAVLRPDGDRMAAAEQDQVHQQPRGTAVAVVERMNGLLVSEDAGGTIWRVSRNPD